MKKKIVIVGGGNAGWMTATQLSKDLGHLVDIQLIESDKVPTVGVGESGPPHLTDWLVDMGFDIYDFMKATGSIQKLGNRFVDWAGKGTYENFAFSWAMPAEILLKTPDMYTSDKDIGLWEISKNKTSDYFAKMYYNGAVGRWDQYHQAQHYYMNKVKSPMMGRDPLFTLPGAYAHHADAALVADYLKDKLLDKIEYTVDTVKNITVKDRNITSLTLESGKIVEGDLFVDCTGFRRLLLTELLPRVKYYKDNFIDRAWVCQYKYNDTKTEMVNYTQSIAQPHGWQFIITLWERFGTGYCYSSSHVDDEAALEEFKNMTNHEQLFEPRLLKWDPSRLEDFGVNNCCTIGLSQGFVEPMEANAFAIIVNGIKMLTEALDDAYHFAPKPVPDWSNMNYKMGKFIDQVAEFILLHYTLGDNLYEDNKFWRDMKKLGKLRNHEAVCLAQYKDPESTFAGNLKQTSMYPDSMWVEMAAAWGCNIEAYTDDSEPFLSLSEQVFTHRESRHRIISDSMMDYIDWHKQFVLKNG